MPLSDTLPGITCSARALQGNSERSFRVACDRTPHASALELRSPRLLLNKKAKIFTNRLALGPQRFQFASGEGGEQDYHGQPEAGRGKAASNLDALDLVERDRVAGAVIELRRARTFVRRHGLGVFEGAAASR
jgi:hypothetical protein